MMATKKAIVIVAAVIVGILTAYAPARAQSLMDPESLHAQAPAKYLAKFVTTKGTFVVEVTRDWAPRGADRFYNLVKNGFYNNSSFFRVIPGFDPVTQSNVRGTLTYATSGRDSRTTQVFINLTDNTRLDRMHFAPFGKVVKGMEVVEKLYSGYGDEPPGGRGPIQTRITNEGKAYLDQNFPKLDSIKEAVIETEPSAKPTKENK
jgi:peptidyl-prolyl cis-trans isomerase A (cyclophilin A)